MPSDTNAANLHQGVLIETLRDLKRWLEYGDIEAGVGEHSALAWINALAAVIESMEARNRGR